MSTNSTIPYNTWGGVSTYSTTPTQVENPYTISNLQVNYKVNSSINIDNRTVITNMVNYAKNNIPNHTRIVSIPSGHLPSDLDTSTAQNWRYAFAACPELISLPDPFYNTSNAIDMSWMFAVCFELTTVPNFDTSNVTNMAAMFRECYRLTTIPNFNTSKVTDMSSMFNCCFNIKGDLYIESNNVTMVKGLFAEALNYTKNIYCHANTNTYNAIYKAMGNKTYNSNWNAYLKTF